MPRPVEAFVTALSDTTEQPLATEISAELIDLVEEPSHVAPISEAPAALTPSPSIAPESERLPAPTTPAELAPAAAAPAAEAPHAPASSPHPALPPPPPVPSSIGLRADTRSNVIAPPRTFTTTASDWPIAQVPSAPTLLLPEFGDRPQGAPDPTRFSLPAFLPPPGMLLEASNGNAIVDAAELVAPDSAASEPALAFAASIEPSTQPTSLAAPHTPAMFTPASSSPAAGVDEPIETAPVQDLAAPMDAAFAELDELNQPDFRRSFLPANLISRLPRWACFAAGIGLGVVATLILS